ncbi:uncharacterized protein LOC127698230 isoform X3 [Mytilus californianus]|uniref:uncharacterized protein LOC127698230 isoform X3 n=1 Tax=Mytilus californianus TaxID=6549 RepID=UPI002246DDC1|nr:uncharacterized protein LOC127698230 isoform X3 [Mytilus californianus]
MNTDFCNGCTELVGPPPIPPPEFLPQDECHDIISTCQFLSSQKSLWSNFSEDCLHTVTVSTATLTTTDAGFPAWLIGVIVVAVLAIIIVVVIIVACIIKKAKGESPERRADYVLTDYHRVNYLHNKMEKGEKYKRRKKSRQDKEAERSSNNNIEDHSNHTMSLPAISTIHGTSGASARAGYDELSKCYTRQSNELESSYLSDSESNKPLSADREFRFSTSSCIDNEHESNSTTSSQRDDRIYTPTILDGELESKCGLASRGSKKESPYAISSILPNVPASHIDDHPPPAPHGMYANHQFEKLKGFQNRCFVDEEHKNKPLPPNPFPDLRSHTTLQSSLYDNAGENSLYKKNKKPVPKKRQLKNQENIF